MPARKRKAYEPNGYCQLGKEMEEIFLRRREKGNMGEDGVVLRGSCPAGHLVPHPEATCRRAR